MLTAYSDGRRFSNKVTPCHVLCMTTNVSPVQPPIDLNYINTKAMGPESPYYHNK